MRHPRHRRRCRRHLGREPRGVSRISAFLVEFLLDFDDDFEFEWRIYAISFERSFSICLLFTIELAKPGVESCLLAAGSGAHEFFFFRRWRMRRGYKAESPPPELVGWRAVWKGCGLEQYLSTQVVVFLYELPQGRITCVHRLIHR